MRQRISEFPALMDGAGRLRGDMAWDPARERKLLEESLHPLFVLRNVRVDLAVGPFQVCVRNQPGAAMARSGDVNRVEVVLLDDAVEMNVHEIQAGRRPPMAQQARL